MQKIMTENRNENTKDIDIISTLDIVKKINVCFLDCLISLFVR